MTAIPVSALGSVPSELDALDPLDEWVDQWVDEEFDALVRELEPAARRLPPPRATGSRATALEASAPGRVALGVGPDTARPTDGNGRKDTRGWERAPPKPV